MGRIHDEQVDAEVAEARSLAGDDSCAVCGRRPNDAPHDEPDQRCPNCEMPGYELWVVLDGDAIVGPFSTEQDALQYAQHEFEPDGTAHDVRKVIDP